MQIKSNLYKKYRKQSNLFMKAGIDLDFNSIISFSFQGVPVYTCMFGNPVGSNISTFVDRSLGSVLPLVCI